MRFLFCPIALHGFVYPAIGIASHLRRMGHEVAFVTEPHFREVIEQHGLVYIPFGREERSTFTINRAGHPFAVGLQVAHIDHALAQFPADALLASEMAFGALIAGERYGLPTAVLGLAERLIPANEQELSAPVTDAQIERTWRYTQMMQLYRQVRDIYSLPDRREDIDHTPLLGDLFLLQSVAELQEPGRTLPERVHLVGSCLWEPVGHDTQLHEWLDLLPADQDLLYVQLGRFFANPCFWPALLEVLKKRPVRVVIAADRTDVDLGTVPDRWLVRRHVPQGTVLSHTTALITNGHTTPVLGGLTAGIPSLLLPNGSGTVENAEMCVRVGAALCENPHTVDAATLERSVERLLTDPQLRRGARQAQVAFGRFDGPRRAAQLLEEMAVSRQGPTGGTAIAVGASRT